VGLRQGRDEEGRVHLRRYLELLPHAPDARLVATLLQERT